MTKRMLTAVLTVALTLSLTACGSKDAPSGSAERERGADYHGVSDLLRCGERAVNVGCDFGGDGRLTELSHRVAEHFAVLGAVDRSGIGTEEAHSRAVEESA